MSHITDINLTDKNFIRSGIIPINNVNGTLFFAFGVDTSTGKLTDFGGHREYQDYDLLDTALREYREESYETFGLLDRETIKNLHIIIGYDTFDILLPINGDLDIYRETFSQRVLKDPEPEISNIVWLSRRQLLRLLESSPQVFYDKIYLTLKKNINSL